MVKARISSRNQPRYRFRTGKTVRAQDRPPGEKCHRCGHPRNEHRYNSRACRHVGIESHQIYDVDRPDDGREIITHYLFCDCKGMVT